MLILLGVALFGFGLLLFSLGIAVWLLGLVIRIALRLLQLALLIALAITAARADVVIDDGQFLVTVPDARGGVRADPDYGLVVKASDADSEGFWVGPRYYWPDGNMGNTVYDRRYRAYTWLDRSVPTMADAPSWLRYLPKPRWQVIGRSQRR
jgi:hypothetical protein